MKICLLNDKTRTVRTQSGFEVIEYYLLTFQEVGGATVTSLILADVHGSVPQIGDQHPFYTNLRLDQVTCRWLQPQVMHCEIELVWRQRDAYVVRLGSSLNSRQRSFGINAGGTAYDVPLVTDYQGEVQHHTVAMRQAANSIEVTRDYNILAGPHPLVHKRLYEGKVNATPWPPSLLDPAQTWMCERISFPLWASASAIVPITYEFVHNPEGWRFQVEHEQDGRPAEGITVGNGGILVANGYPQANFTELGLAIL